MTLDRKTLKAAAKVAAYEMEKANKNLRLNCECVMPSRNAENIWTGRLVAAQEIKSAILALSDTPPEPVSVQEAARVLLRSTPAKLSAGIDALHKAAEAGRGADFCLANALRALSEGQTNG